MTLRTVTYDDSTHKIVPIEPCEKSLSRLTESGWANSRLGIWKAVVKAAPEYQDKIADLESRDFYEVMQAYRHEQLHVARRFEFVKQWLRNPTYEYQEPVKDDQC